ncbi:hypothetical protein C7G42_08185 [Bradyrhizobium sp. MOS003]|jgi:hypothetical protein|nr:hypothetical protein C7G42_08185 [Bradyrhizobium sp. MOS003]
MPRTAANVQELDRNGTEGIGWCFAPVGALVPGDVMLAQKIVLEISEGSDFDCCKPSSLL